MGVGQANDYAILKLTFGSSIQNSSTMHNHSFHGVLISWTISSIVPPFEGEDFIPNSSLNGWMIGRNIGAVICPRIVFLTGES